MATPEPPQEAQNFLSAWGNHSMTPTGLATLISALHLRPLQVRPMLFVPVLLFGSYINLQGFKKDAAGITAAASGTYALLALRRGRGSARAGGGVFGRLGSKFSVRGVVRGAAVGLGLVNLLGCGWVYATADREKEKREREENPRWAE